MSFTWRRERTKTVPNTLHNTRIQIAKKASLAAVRFCWDVVWQLTIGVGNGEQNEKVRTWLGRAKTLAIGFEATPLRLALVLTAKTP